MKTPRVIGLLAIFTACVVAGIVSCDSAFRSNTAGANAGTGSLRVLITDKPYPFEYITEALVTVTRLDVRLDDGSDDDSGNENENENENSNDNEAAGDQDDGDGSFITVFEGERVFNLLDLQNGRTDLLGEAEIPAGTYTQARLIVTEGQITIVDDDGNERVFVLRVPSGAQTGIKIHLTFEVEDGEETVLLLDVDMSRAFSPIPGGKIDNPDEIRNFRFTPSIAMRLIRLLDAAQITGRVVDPDAEPIEDVSVSALKDGEEVSTTSTEADGTYVLGGLPTGDYTIEFSASGFNDTQIGPESAAAGETLQLDDVTLEPTGG